MKDSFAERFREGLRAPASPEALEVLWPELPDSLPESEGAIAGYMTTFLDQEETAVGAAVGAREALGVGVVSAVGVLEFSEPLLHDCLSGVQNDPAMRTLLARARAEGAAVGLLSAANDAVVAAWAGTLAQARGRWPLPPQAETLLKLGGGRLAIVVYAPTRSTQLAARASAALDFTPLEARLADALLTTPTLETAAAAIGVGRATARDALQRMCAKAGVRRSTELVRKLVDLMCQASAAGSHEDVLAECFGLTRSEARVAGALGAGVTAPDAALALGLKAETVRGYARVVLAKTGVKRTKDLARLLVETRELTMLAGVDDAVFAPDPEIGRLRVIPTTAGRQIAFIDYGPKRGRVVLVLHGSASGRSLPPVFVEALHDAGLRPVAVQRPGFGLTDIAGGDFLNTAADDMVAVLDCLKAVSPLLLAREGATATVLRLAERCPGRVGRVVLVNPRTPIHLAREPTFPLAVASRHLLGNPALVGPFAEMIRRRGTRARLERLARQSCSESATDLRVLEDAAVLDGLVRDIQALTARSVAGFVAEFRVWADGWTVPQVNAGRWTIVRPGDLPQEPVEAYAGLPHARIVRLDGGGFLTWFTHAEELARLLVEP